MVSFIPMEQCNFSLTFRIYLFLTRYCDKPLVLLSSFRPRSVKNLVAFITAIVICALILYTENPEVLEDRGLENPSVQTRLLYTPGHGIDARNLCTSSQGIHLKLLVLITSSPRHWEKRETIRRTWGHIALRKDIALAFFIGKSTKLTETAKVMEESNIYGDIVQGNFIDTYNNLTLKTVSLLEWTLNYCNQARFILKTDDDMYINFPVLFSVMDNRLQNMTRAIVGKVVKHWKPFRNPKSPYYLSGDQYSGSKLPDFCTGPAYVLTKDVIGELYEASLNGIFFKLEDVYVTGIIASRLSIQHIHVHEFYNTRTFVIHPCYAAKAATIHNVKKEEMHSLWKALSLGVKRCASITT